MRKWLKALAISVVALTVGLGIAYGLISGVMYVVVATPWGGVACLVLGIAILVGWVTALVRSVM